ncbi:MAG TPA: hypothetical protein VIV15_08190, partial [Anaerolineales bacterium]
MSLLTPKLLERILKEYALPWRGTHGITHWARVLENARGLAQLTGADLQVVELFAVFHDSRRMNERVDHGHGRRGAALARELRGTAFDLDDGRLALLEYACAEHTHGLTTGDISVQVCWDADRLDLLRVGIQPHPNLLCTEAAREPEIL